MTVQEVIDRLNREKDKSITVNVVDYFNGHGEGWDEVATVYEHTLPNGKKLLVID